MSKLVLLDNQDSFVYNLVDALSGFDATVFRNTVSVDAVLGADPDVIILSPGPGYPADAGCMMELIERAQGRIRSSVFASAIRPSSSTSAAPSRRAGQSTASLFPCGSRMTGCRVRFSTVSLSTADPNTVNKVASSP